MKPKNIFLALALCLFLLPLGMAVTLSGGTVLNATGSNSTLTFDLVVTVNSFYVAPNAVYLNTITYTQDNVQKVCTELNYTTANSNLPASQFNCAIQGTPGGIGGSGGTSTTNTTTEEQTTSTTKVGRLEGETCNPFTQNCAGGLTCGFWSGVCEDRTKTETVEATDGSDTNTTTSSGGLMGLINGIVNFIGQIIQNILNLFNK